MTRDFIKRPIEDILVEFVADLTETTAEDGGKAWIGLCPFHADTNPSFSAYYNGSDDNSWCCCWACWPEGGDVIDFIIKYQKDVWHKDISFKEALSLVADPVTAEESVYRVLTKLGDNGPNVDLVDLSNRIYNLMQKVPADVAHRMCYHIDLAIVNDDVNFINDTLRRFHC